MKRNYLPSLNTREKPFTKRSKSHHQDPSSKTSRLTPHNLLVTRNCCQVTPLPSFLPVIKKTLFVSKLRRIESSALKTDLPSIWQLCRYRNVILPRVVSPDCSSGITRKQAIFTFSPPLFKISPASLSSVDTKLHLPTRPINAAISTHGPVLVAITYAADNYQKRFSSWMNLLRCTFEKIHYLTHYENFSLSISRNYEFVGRSYFIVGLLLTFSEAL